MANIKINNNVNSHKCGIIMPISSLDGCNEQHWKDVKKIISDSIIEAGFEPNLVSLADDVSVIQKRIIQNIYDNPIIVCDVSGKNSNVMFELGMRLTFDKATIIIKDDKTSYSFDTSPIEHLTYPRDLRFNDIVEFKKNLIEKIQATYKKSTTDPNYSTFLKHFGKFTITKLDTTEVSKEDFIIEELKDIRNSISSLNRRDRIISPLKTHYFKDEMLNSYHDNCHEQLQILISEKLNTILSDNDKLPTNEIKSLVRKYVLQSDNLPTCWDTSQKICQQKLEELIASEMIDSLWKYRKLKKIIT